MAGGRRPRPRPPRRPSRAARHARATGAYKRAAVRRAEDRIAIRLPERRTPPETVVAVFLLVLGKEIALPAILGHISDSSDAHALAFAWTALILLGVGLVVGALGSGLTLRRYLKV